MNPVIPIFIVCLLALLVAVSEASTHSMPGTDCTSGSGLSSLGVEKIARDHTLLAVAQDAQDPGTSGAYILGDHCLVFGDSLMVGVYGPNASVPLTIVQYTIAYGANDTWHAPIVNSTGATIRPAYWTNVSQPYWASPTWSNVTLSVTPWRQAVIPLTLVSAPSARHLSISYDGAGYDLWHLTPTSLLPLSQSLGQEWGHIAEFSILMMVVAGMAIVLGASVSRDLLAPPRKWSIAVVVFSMIAGAVVLGADYMANWEAWQMTMGGIASYAVVVIPEFFFLTVVVVMVWPSKAVFTAELTLNGEVEEEDPTLNLPGYWVAKHPDGGYAYVPRGFKQGLYRLLLGKRAYCPHDDHVLAKHPFRFRVRGVISRCYVLPAGRKTKVVLPHVEFFVRDPPPTAHEEWSEDSIQAEKDGIDRAGAVPKAPVVKGKLHLIRFNAGYRATPAVGKAEAKLILQHVAEELAVAEIEMDRQVLENENIDLHAQVETGKAQRARALTRRFFDGAAHAREEPKVSSSEAVRQALAELERQRSPRPPTPPAGAAP